MRNGGTRYPAAPFAGRTGSSPYSSIKRQAFGQGFCEEWRLIYITPRMDGGSRAEFYATYGQKYPDSFLVDPKNPYRQIAAKRATFFESFCRRLSRRPEALLEVGCSYGFFIEELKKKGLPIARTRPRHHREVKVEFARRVNGLAKRAHRAHLKR